jgi:glycine/D-amino acid oxidase-like deaminating enzyme
MPAASTRASAQAALAEAAQTPFWLDRPDRPAARPALAGPIDADLAVVGGGYSGLWTALQAKQSDPSRDVVLLESGVCGDAASGRNGGFCSASLTHGTANGAERFPGELATLERLGRENLAGIETTINEYGIDCAWERTGELAVATQPWQVDGLTEAADLAAAHGGKADVLDADAVRAEVNSPTYLGGVWLRDGTALVDPARLAWGLRRVCLDLGVRIFEGSAVTGLRADGPALRLSTADGTVRAARVALATNAFPPLLRRLRHYIVPVYDYALVTEPLLAAQRDAIGWRKRQGLADTANQFHYYRLTADDRILWGGYDAVYYYGNAFRPELEQRAETFEALATQFYDTFPQLGPESDAPLRFTHRWGGVIDTCSRFCAFFGTAYDGRLAYAVGYTGLGVGATRFGARVMLDLLGREPTELTRLDFVRRKPLPFPPEPLRYAGIQLTRRSLARADERGGRRDLWLRTLDRLGLGFDS